MPRAQTSKTASKAARVQFVEPMYAELVQQLPNGKNWLCEVKFDGYRSLAGRDATGVKLWSRRGNDFTAQFPNIGQGCESLPVGTVLDGEIVAPSMRAVASLSTISNITDRKHKRSYSMCSMY
jgi:bifunctional non-homologous end joining protein LigD